MYIYVLTMCMHLHETKFIILVKPHLIADLRFKRVGVYYKDNILIYTRVTKPLNI